MKKIIIVGGGFAGITAGLKLLKNNFSVTLFNPKANFEFCPLLPDALIKNNPALAEFSFAPLLAYKNFKLVAEKVVKIDTNTKTVFGQNTAVQYDYLLIATGLDGRLPMAGAEEHSVLFKSVADIKKISAYFQNKINQNEKITVNVIGAGATGVETALAIVAYFKNKTKNWQINLFHNQAMPIGNNPQWLATTLVQILKTQGVNFLPNESITRLCPDGVVCGTNLHNSQLNILTAGGRANANFAPAEILNERGFIGVDEFLQTKIAGIFAAGDVSSSPNLKTAQAAEYEGNVAAKNIIALANGRPLGRNLFKLRGFIMLTGVNTAAGNAGPFKLNGRVANLLRYGAYLMSLPGIKNRLKLLRNL